MGPVVCVVSDMWGVSGMWGRAARQMTFFFRSFRRGAFLMRFLTLNTKITKKKFSKIGNNWLFGAKVLIYCQKINVFIYFLKGAISPNNHCFYPKHA